MENIELNRKFIGGDLDPKWCQLAKERITNA